MAVFSVVPQAIAAGVQLDSDGVQPSTQLRSAQVNLTDPNNLWPISVDPTRHIQQWGLMYSTNSTNGINGAWQWGPVYQGDPLDTTRWLAFGLRDKSGGLPWLLWAPSNKPVPAGAWIRLSILTDAPITLGATITTT